MLKLNVKTKRNPEEVVKKAMGFFGPAGRGLTVTQQSDTCVSFEGGAGYVAVAACTSGEGASVDLETREWEREVREFARKI